MLEHLIMEAFLMGLIVFLKVQHWMESKDLLNRLMARDLPELLSWENEKRKLKIPDKIRHKDGIPL